MRDTWRYDLRLCIAGILSASAAAAAAAAELEGDDGPQVMAEMVVTGTRVPERSAFDTTAPVDVVSGETLATRGITELAQTLSVSIPSLVFPRPSAADGPRLGGLELQHAAARHLRARLTRHQGAAGSVVVATINTLSSICRATSPSGMPSFQIRNVAACVP